MKIKELFGPSKKVVWEEYANQRNLELYQSKKGSVQRIEIPHHQLIIHLDTYVVHTGSSMIYYTRLRVPFNQIKAFDFRIFRSHMLTGFLKFFSYQDVEIGNPDFDHKFVIKGSDERMLKNMFRDHMFRKLLAKEKQFELKIHKAQSRLAKKLPEGVGELSYHVVGLIKDPVKLDHLTQMMKSCLDQLEKIEVLSRDTSCLHSY
ncbi:MAG: hypothetical protein R8P61_14425 [Bacteroidia bacterium]|nr:hypothetical protein [Bacteroidia bacterium]